MIQYAPDRMKVIFPSFIPQKLHHDFLSNSDLDGKAIFFLKQPRRFSQKGSSTASTMSGDSSDGGSSQQE